MLSVSTIFCHLSQYDVKKVKHYYLSIFSHHALASTFWFSHNNYCGKFIRGIKYR